MIYFMKFVAQFSSTSSSKTKSRKLTFALQLIFASLAMAIYAEQLRKSASSMSCDFEDAFWDDLLTRIGEGEVVPVVGRGAVTFGSSNELLYPQLAQRVATELNPR